MQTSAGTLLFRRGNRGLEVLLVHAAGNFNRHAPWGIPKGIPLPGEPLADAARRETWEEVGIHPGELIPLGDVVYQSRKKRVHCFCGEAPANGQPRCASREIDAVEFVPVDEARKRMHRDQAMFIDRLKEALAHGSLGSERPRPTPERAENN